VLLLLLLLLLLLVSSARTAVPLATPVCTVQCASSPAQLVLYSSSCSLIVHRYTSKVLLQLQLWLPVALLLSATALLLDATAGAIQCASTHSSSSVTYRQAMQCVAAESTVTKQLQQSAVIECIIRTDIAAVGEHAQCALLEWGFRWCAADAATAVAPAVSDSLLYAAECITEMNTCLYHAAASVARVHLSGWRAAIRQSQRGVAVLANNSAVWTDSSIASVTQRLCCHEIVSAAVQSIVRAAAYLQIPITADATPLYLLHCVMSMCMYEQHRLHCQQ
jgi:hypothetical protein